MFKVTQKIKFMHFQNNLKSYRKNLTRMHFNAKQTMLKSQQEVKPFKSMPTLPLHKIFFESLPGGQFHNTSMDDILKSVFSELGGIMKIKGRFGYPSIVATSNPEDFETIFRNDGMHPQRNTLSTFEYYSETSQSFLFNGEHRGLITQQGESWHKFRSLVNPIFATPNFASMYIDQVDEVARDFVNFIETCRDGKNEAPANFYDCVKWWSMESITLIMFKRRLHLLDRSKTNEISETTIEAIKLTENFWQNTLKFESQFPVWRILHTKKFTNLLNSFRAWEERGLKFVDDSIELLKNPKAENGFECILEKLLKVDIRVAKIMSFESIATGIDTVSFVLCGILYCLAKNPEKQQNLRDEISNILTNSSDPLTKDNMQNIPYLRAVIKEGLRVFPPLSVNLRRLNKDLVLSGYDVPKGTDVFMAMSSNFRHDRQHDRPLEFIPERWMKNNRESEYPSARTVHPFFDLPFGFGARSCIGKRLAQLKLEVVLIRIIRNFKVEWNYGPMKVKSFLVNYLEGDLKFKFTKSV